MMLSFRHVLLQLRRDVYLVEAQRKANWEVEGKERVYVSPVVSEEILVKC